MSEFHKRMASDGKGLRKLYVMQLGASKFLDAKYKGGLARYLNHSCEPVCSLDRWRAEGRVRMAIFASKDLPKGTELTLDYQWQARANRPRTKCLCMSAKCRGYLEVDGDGAEIGGDAMGFWRKPNEAELSDPMALIDRRVKVFYDGEEAYYEGLVVRFDESTRKHWCYYQEEGEEHEEDLSWDEGKRDHAWQIWEDSEVANIIKRKERTSEEPSDGAEVAAAPPSLQQPKTEVRSRYYGPNTVRSFFISGAEAEKISRYTPGDPSLIHTIVSKTKSVVDLNRRTDPRAKSIDGKLLKLCGPQQCVTTAITILRKALIELHPLDGWKEKPVLQEEKAAAPVVVAPPPRVRSRWCHGRDWFSFRTEEIEDAMRSAAVKGSCKSGLRIIKQISDGFSVVPSLTVHANVLLHRYLVLAGQSGSSARLESNSFVLASAVFMLANKAVRGRTSAVTPLKQDLLLETAYSTQFPGRKAKIERPEKSKKEKGKSKTYWTEEAKSWVNKVALCEQAILGMLGFDLYFPDPFLLAYENMDCPVNVEAYQRACQALIHSSGAGSHLWLQQHPLNIAKAAVLIGYGQVETDDVMVWRREALQRATSYNGSSDWASVETILAELYNIPVGKATAVTQLPGPATGAQRHSFNAQSCINDIMKLAPRAVDASKEKQLHLSDFRDLEGALSRGGLNQLAAVLSSSVLPNKLLKLYLSAEDVAAAGLNFAIPHLQTTAGEGRECYQVYLRKLTLTDDSAKEGQSKQPDGKEAGGHVTTVALNELSTLQILHSASSGEGGMPNIMLPIALVKPSQAHTARSQGSSIGSQKALGGSLSDFGALGMAGNGLSRLGTLGSDLSTSQHHPMPQVMHLLLEPLPYTLAEVLKVSKRPFAQLPERFIRQIARGLFGALAACHSQNIVIRHLDPSQIYLRDSGQVKLGCLSSALRVSDEDATHDSGRAHTARKPDEPRSKHLPYMAPEVLLGAKNHMKASDVWAMTCLTVYLANQKPLFCGENRLKQLGQVYKSLGTPSESNWPQGMDMPFYAALKVVDKQTGKPLACKPRFQKVLEALKLSEGLKHVLVEAVKLDPASRPTAEQLMSHPFLMSPVDERWESDLGSHEWRRIKTYLDALQKSGLDGVKEAMRQPALPEVGAPARPRASPVAATSGAGVRGNGHLGAAEHLLSYTNAVKEQPRAAEITAPASGTPLARSLQGTAPVVAARVPLPQARRPKRSRWEPVTATADGHQGNGANGSSHVKRSRSRSSSPGSSRRQKVERLH
ncbi:unnamed protein product [Chrysoparadoxa australica]